MATILLWMCIGMIAAFIVKRRGRYGWKWFLLSLLLGPLAFIIVFLPAGKK
jgi:hypothetical protein